MNEDHLSAAVAWIRLLLEREALPDASADRAVADAGVGAAAQRLRELEAADPLPHFVRIANTFGLTPFERSLLLLCAAAEFDTRIAPLCARAQRSDLRPYPTLALALALVPEQAAWDALSPERPLRYWRLLEIAQAHGQPLIASALRADERILNEIKGLAHLDERLTPYLFPLDVPHEHAPVPPSTQGSIDAIARLIRGIGHAPLPLLQLTGNDRESKQIVAARVAEALHAHLLRLAADLLPGNAAEVELLARLWNREMLLLPVALFIDSRNGDESARISLRRFLLRVSGIVFLDAADSGSDVANARTFAIDKPLPSEQRELWQSILSDPAAASRMASHFDLSVPRIRRIEAELASFPPNERAERVWPVAQAYTHPRLGALAQRIDCKATWDDIVLPDADLRLLRRIAGQVAQRTTVYDDWGFRDRMNRGLGISALFIGDSGTGKTMAAEIIANDLHLDLYRIDLANVLNKYIGETEKNIAKMFDEAENAILFFDEAEALFGRRVESRDSHDRYANIEVAYLLQRIESYRGLAILATNKRAELDHAFMRRIRFLVNFPFPGPAERKAIWRKALPPALPIEPLDLDRLARLNVAGGSVHTIVLNAAFVAASRGTPVSMPLLLDAARVELRKLDRPANEADLKWTAEALAS